MDVAFLTYEGYAVDPVETHLNLEKPVYLLGQHFKPDERKSFYFFVCDFVFGQEFGFC